MTRRILWLAASVLLVNAACGDAAPPAGTPAPEAASVPAPAAEPSAPVQPDELAAVLAADGGPLLLDVRTPEEFAQGHIAGATHVPVQELEARLGELAAYRERGVVTYCESGRRAGQASELLRGAGFAHVRVLDGSMRRWREEGRAVATQ